MVVLKKGMPEPDDLRAFCEARRARFKCPSLIEFAVRLPRAATGKITKGKLKRTSGSDRPRPARGQARMSPLRPGAGGHRADVRQAGGVVGRGLDPRGPRARDLYWEQIPGHAGGRAGRGNLARGPGRPAGDARRRATLTTMSVRVALLQVSITDDEPVGERIERVLAMTAEVAADHDLVVLPDLWPIGAFAIDLMPVHAEPLHGPLSRALAEVAVTSGAWVFGGSFAERVEAESGENRLLQHGRRPEPRRGAGGRVPQGPPLRVQRRGDVGDDERR